MICTHAVILPGWEDPEPVLCANTTIPGRTVFGKCVGLRVLWADRQREDAETITTRQRMLAKCSHDDAWVCRFLTPCTCRDLPSRPCPSCHEEGDPKRDWARRS